MKTLLLAFLPTILFAQNKQSDSTKTELLNEVVITANRSANQEFQTPNSIKVLNKKYLKTYASRTTPEALMGVNGVFVQKTNHGGGSPFVRGLTGNQTLLLVDGIRLSNSTFRYGPNQYFNTIDPFSIEKIEVLKGAGSVQYGSDALGGTIQVFTADPVFGSRWKTNLLGRIATQGMEQTARAEVNYGGENLAISGSFGYRNFGDLVGGKLTGRQSPSGYDEQMGNLKAKLKLGRGILTMAHQYFEAKDVPVYHKVVLENFAINEFQPQRRNLSYLKFNQINDSKIVRDVSITGSVQMTYEGRGSQKNGSVRFIQETDKVYTKALAGNIFSAFSDKWTANSGIEIYHDLVRSSKVDRPASITSSSAPKILRGLYPDNSTFLNYSVYSLHQFIQNQWQFSAGLRYNGFSIVVPDETIGKTNLKPQALVPNVSIAYLIGSKSNIYASYNAGFRTPNIDDLGTLGIVDFRYELPTNDLKPEKSNNYELGYKFRTDRFSATTALYYSDLRDLIARIKVPNQVIDNYSVYRKENIEKATIKGIEAEFEGLISKELKTYGGVSYTYGQNITKNEPMRRMPPLNGRLGLEYRKKKFFLRPELLFAAKQDRLAQGDKDDNRIGKNGTAAWQILNIYSGYEYKCLNISISAQNLTNKDYRTHGSGINGVGRSLWLTLNLEI
ncbi:MAG: TonB-dependent receptor plug domain-containing protein [Emticicia sp.]|uniref:TonB-dependent receptor plug domain-containing protein n=1 Tax=Emticicia sp. TaxID=1930953 RepID=UPI003BA68221